MPSAAASSGRARSSGVHAAPAIEVSASAEIHRCHSGAASSEETAPVPGEYSDWNSAEPHVP